MRHGFQAVSAPLPDSSAARPRPWMGHPAPSTRRARTAVTTDHFQFPGRPVQDEATEPIPYVPDTTKASHWQIAHITAMTERQASISLRHPIGLQPASIAGVSSN